MLGSSSFSEKYSLRVRTGVTLPSQGSVGGVTDVTLIYVKALLASAGLKASDVDFVYAKAAGDRFSALVSGGIDATILNPPTYFKAEAAGIKGEEQPRSRTWRQAAARGNLRDRCWA